MTKKYFIREKQTASNANLTTGLLDALNIKLCIPIHGNALNASKKLSVLPYGVSFKTNNMKAGEAIIVA